MQELQRHAVFTLVGLIAFFPIFNQVADSSQDALRDADHKASFKDFLKSWDDIPEDEKLSYWDGKSKPPGQQGDIDEDRIDDDGRFHQPEEPPPSDRDGDGVTDTQDPDPDDPRVTDNESKAKVRTEVVILYTFTGDEQPSNDDSAEIDIDRTADGEEWVLEQAMAAWDIESFAGTFQFRLSDGQTQKWDLNSGNNNIPNPDFDDDGETRPFQADGDMTMAYTYSPLPGTTPDKFSVTVKGQYRVYTE